MKKFHIPGALLVALMAPTLASAQVPGGQEPPVSDPSVKVKAPTLPVITDDTKLYETYGGREGLTRIMDDFMDRLVANPRTRPMFKDSDKERIKLQLVEQFCIIMNGPCTYSGRSMAEAHTGRNISEESFYALVEELQISLNKFKVPFRAQNRLIAALAPMNRDIIDR